VCPGIVSCLIRCNCSSGNPDSQFGGTSEYPGGALRSGSSITTHLNRCIVVIRVFAGARGTSSDIAIMLRNCLSRCRNLLAFTFRCEAVSEPFCDLDRAKEDFPNISQPNVG